MHVSLVCRIIKGAPSGVFAHVEPAGDRDGAIVATALCWAHTS